MSDMDVRVVLAEKREDRFSALLGSLLRMDHFRSAFLGLLSWREGAAERWRVDLQVPVAGGIADVALESQVRLALLEAKLDAPFTEGQPVSYARHLLSRRAESPGLDLRLVLLVPASSAVSYEETAAARLLAAGLDLAPAVVLWEDTARLAHELAVTAPLQERPLLRAFADLVTAYVGDLPRPLEDAEISLFLSPAVRHAAREAQGLVGPVFDVLRRELGPALAEGAVANGHLYSGRNLTWHARPYWLGLWVEAWLRYGEGLLWVQAYGRNSPVSSSRAAAMGLREWSGLICPLRLRPGLERGPHAEHLARTCIDFMRAEAAAGADPPGEPSGSAAPPT